MQTQPVFVTIHASNSSKIEEEQNKRCHWKMHKFGQKQVCIFENRKQVCIIEQENKSVFLERSLYF